MLMVIQTIVNVFLFGLLSLAIIGSYSYADSGEVSALENDASAQDKLPIPPSGRDLLLGKFDEVLRAHVANGWVDYPGIAADPRFANHIERLSEADLERLSTREEQLAFWINAYNAFAIKGILDGNSPRTFFGKIRFFKTTDYRAGGREIDLYDLEHEILIPLREPRIHFSIVCASKSCPKLRSDAYTEDRLDDQLDENARNFINDDQRNRFDRAHKVAYLSEIFKWFNEDFERHSGSVQRYLAQYVDDRELAQDLAAHRYTVKYLKYDWSVNGVPPGSSADGHRS